MDKSLSVCYIGQISSGLGHPYLLMIPGKISADWFKENKRNGFCIEEFPSHKYEGTYINDCLSGRGIITFKDGTKYIGQFYKAKFCGFGKFIWPDGSYFIGEFKDFRRYKGLSFYSEDRGLFDAIWEWELNKENEVVLGKGEGTYYLPNGKKQKRIRIINKEKGHWQYF